MCSAGAAEALAGRLALASTCCSWRASWAKSPRPIAMRHSRRPSATCLWSPPLRAARAAREEHAIDLAVVDLVQELAVQSSLLETWIGLHQMAPTQQPTSSLLLTRTSHYLVVQLYLPTTRTQVSQLA